MITIKFLIGLSLVFAGGIIAGIQIKTYLFKKGLTGLIDKGIIKIDTNKLMEFTNDPENKEGLF